MSIVGGFLGVSDDVDEEHGQDLRVFAAELELQLCLAERAFACSATRLGCAARARSDSVLHRGDDP